VTTPPVLFLVFNRPDTTARVFAAIREARPARLYVAADGPRADREGEAERCAEVRRLATAVDWPCEVETLFRDENLGCRRAVSGAITWFFEHEPEGIILEDDTLPAPVFFSYCARMLARYRHRSDVFMVGGYNHLPRRFGRTGHFLSRYPQVWGWASWADRWRHYDDTFAEFPDDLERARAAGFIKHWETLFWRRRLGDVVDGSLDTWDHPWQFAILKQDGRCVRATCNLVENIGFGPDATHTVRENLAVSANRAVNPRVRSLERRVPIRPFEDARFFERKLRNRGRVTALDYLRWTAPQGLARALRRVRGRLRLLRQARRRGRPASRPDSPVPNCLVVSPGGVATTSLMAHVSAFTETNDVNDRDDLKHLAAPPYWLNGEHRVLFLTGRPSRIVASLERRGYRARQAAKLGSMPAVLLPGASGRVFLRRAVERQMARWRAYAEAHPDRVRVIPFEELWTRKQEIAAFLGIADPAFVERFPERRARESR